MQEASHLDIYAYKCVCGNNSPASQNLYESVVCQKCLHRNHRSCYDQFIDDENFLCIRCRLEIWNPFMVIKKPVVEVTNLLANRTEQRIPFHLTKEQIQEITTGSSYLVIMCSVLKFSSSSMYEWPQRALIISLKNDNSRGGNTLKKKNKPNFRSFQRKKSE